MGEAIGKKVKITSSWAGNDYVNQIGIVVYQDVHLVECKMSDGVILNPYIGQGYDVRGCDPDDSNIQAVWVYKDEPPAKDRYITYLDEMIVSLQQGYERYKEIPDDTHQSLAAGLWDTVEEVKKAKEMFIKLNNI